MKWDKDEGSGGAECGEAKSVWRGGGEWGGLVEERWD